MSSISVDAPLPAMAGWLRRHALTFVAIAMLAAVSVGGVGYFREASSPATPALFGNDYLSFYAAGRLALEGDPAAAYDREAHAAKQLEVVKDTKGGGTLPATFYFGYPPTYLALIVPFAALPYYASLFAFMTVTALLYVAAMCLVWPGWRTALFALAVPNACISFGFGQNGFLTAGLVGAGLALLDRSPWVAGTLLGLLAFKPQLGLAFPLVLLVTGRWRPFFAAALTAVLVAAASAVLLGVDTWQAFFAIGDASRSHLLETTVVGFEKIQSLFAALRLAGASVSNAYAGQGVLTAAVAVTLVIVWRSNCDYRLKAAAAATATLLMTPFLLAYDLMIEVPAVAFFVAYAVERGFRPGELVAIAVVLVAPEIGALGVLSPAPVGLIGTVILYFLVVSRSFADAAPAPASAAPSRRTLDPRASGS